MGGKRKIGRLLRDALIDTAETVIIKVQDQTNKEEFNDIQGITPDAALEILYYVMLADETAEEEELEEFERIADSIDPYYSEHRAHLLEICKHNVAKAREDGSYIDALEANVAKALTLSQVNHLAYYTPKKIVWNMMIIANADGVFDENERRLVNFAAELLSVEKQDILEMESSCKTLLELEKETEWIRSSDRPYRTIEEVANELENRKSVIMSNVTDLINL